MDQSKRLGIVLDADNRGYRMQVTRKHIVRGGLAFMALIAVMMSYFTVGERERIVVTRMGAFSYVAGPGLHFKLPILDGTSAWAVSLQEFTTKKLNTYTSDNQEVDATLTVQYVIPVDRVEWLYKNNPDYLTKLEVITADRFKQLMGKVNVADFAEHRMRIKQEVNNLVRTEAERLFGIVIVDVALANIDYQESYLKAVAIAAQVKTQIEASRNLQHKAEIDAETARIAARGTADAAVISARGNADSMKLQGEAQASITRVRGEADAHIVRVRGEAEADAKKAMAASLTANPVLVQFEQATRWNGQLPVNMYAGAPLPLLNIRENK